MLQVKYKWPPEWMPLVTNALAGDGGGDINFFFPPEGKKAILPSFSGNGRINNTYYYEIGIQ